MTEQNPPAISCAVTLSSLEEVTMANQDRISVLDLQSIAVRDDKDAAGRTKVAKISRHAGQGPFSTFSLEACGK